THEGRVSSLRGRAPGAARRAARIQDHRAADLAGAAGAVALPHPRAGHLLRARGRAAALPAGPQGRGPAEAERDVCRARGPSAPGDESRPALGDLPGAAGDRRVRLRAADGEGLSVARVLTLAIALLALVPAPSRAQAPAALRNAPPPAL